MDLAFIIFIFTVIKYNNKASRILLHFNIFLIFLYQHSIMSPNIVKALLKQG